MSQDLQQRIRALRSTERRITPDAAWVRATRMSLLAKVTQDMPALPARNAPQRFADAFRFLVPAQIGAWLRRPVMAFLSLFVVVAGGSVMSVSAAERSVPGDFLYGLKLATEQARLALTSTKEDKLKLKTEFTDRRLDELQYVADKKQPDQVVQVAEILKRDLDTMKQQLTEVAQETPQRAAAAAKLVDKKTNQVIVSLQKTKTQLSPETKEKVTEAQSAAADTGVRALEVLAEKHVESKEEVPAEDIAQAIQEHSQVVADATSSTLPFVLPLSTSTTALSASSSTTDAASSTLPTVLPMILSSTTTVNGVSTTTETIFPAVVGQVKDATTQAFTLQKEKEKQEAEAVMQASSTNSGAADNNTASTSTTSSETGTTSTSSGAVTSTTSTSTNTSSSTTETTSSRGS